VLSDPDRDPVGENAAFEAANTANTLSSDDSFDFQGLFPLKVRIVFRPVLA
jgi:hypothetical protein